MTAIIDADSLIYIIAYNNKEGGTLETVKESCDSFLRDILALTGCNDYYGVFSPKTCFRHTIYRYNPYKGTRPSAEEWLTQWKPVIVDYFTDRHGFFTVNDLEADDVVCALAVLSISCVICSPDKDLRQVPGIFFDYRKKETEFISTAPIKVSEYDADRNFWIQMLMGDTTDAISGVPGLGEKKAAILLDEALDQMQWPSVVLGAYCKYFGSFYGRMIYQETLQTVMMMTPKHPMFSIYQYDIAKYAENKQTLKTGPSIFDIDAS